MYSKNRQDNLTAILYKTDDIRLEQQDVVEPGPDQVSCDIAPQIF